jgi:hypothetical protein
MKKLRRFLIIGTLWGKEGIDLNLYPHGINDSGKLFKFSV